MSVYVDTGAWIALHEARDQNHAAAVERLRALHRAGETLVTGWHTLVEYADGLARHYDQRTASKELATILRSPAIRVAPSEPGMTTALELLSSRADWNVDLSDCLSFALMKAQGIARAFTYDADFRKAGFTIEN